MRIFIIYSTLQLFFSTQLIAEDSSFENLSSIKELSVERYLPDSKTLPPILTLAQSSIAKLDKTNPNCGAKEISQADRKIDRGFEDEALYIKGLIQEKCGNFLAAEDSYAASQALKYSNPKRSVRRAVVAIQLNNPSQALEYLNDADWGDSKSKFLNLYLQASCQDKLKKTDLALKLLTQSRQINPNFLPTLRSETQLTRKAIEKAGNQSEKQKLETNYTSLRNQLLATDPNNRDMSLEKAKSLFISADLVKTPKQLTEALEISEKFISKSNYQDQSFILLKAEILKKLNREQDALQFLNEANEKVPLTAALMALRTRLMESQP